MLASGLVVIDGGIAENTATLPMTHREAEVAILTKLAAAGGPRKGVREDCTFQEELGETALGRALVPRTIFEGGLPACQQRSLPLLV